MIYSYVRQIPSLVSLVGQQRDILSFALTRGLDIDKEVMEYASKNLPIEDRGEFETFLQSMSSDDSVVVSNLSIFSDKLEEIIKVINCMLSRGIGVWVANSQILLDEDTKMVEIFPLLNDLREAQKQKTNQIGRPKGSKSNSKFDIYQAEIINFLNSGMSVSAIARELGVSRSSLKDYIQSRDIKTLLAGEWVDIKSNNHRGLDNVVLICPFEKEKKKLKVS